METLPTAGQAFLSGVLTFFSPCLLAWSLAVLAQGLLIGAALGRGWGVAEAAALAAGYGALFFLQGTESFPVWILSAQGFLSILIGAAMAVPSLLLGGWLPGARVRARWAGVLSSLALGGALVWNGTPCFGPVLGTIFLGASEPDHGPDVYSLLGAHAAGTLGPLLLLFLVARVAGGLAGGSRWLARAAAAAMVLAGADAALELSSRLIGACFQAGGVWSDTLIRWGM